MRPSQAYLTILTILFFLTFSLLTKAQNKDEQAIRNILAAQPSNGTKEILKVL